MLRDRYCKACDRPCRMLSCSFQRAFQVPEGVDTDKIEANFKKGVLTVTLPKSAEAQKAAKKIDVKAA